MTYTVHTVDSAPEAAKDILASAGKRLGFVPNPYAVMAEAPRLVKAYTALSRV